jgi:DNA-binding NtrC family response regulator
MNATILCIVDYYSIRDSLSRTLRRRSYEVAGAPNGSEVFHTRLGAGFDLVLPNLETPYIHDLDTLIQTVTKYLSCSLVIGIARWRMSKNTVALLGVERGRRLWPSWPIRSNLS